MDSATLVDDNLKFYDLIKPKNPHNSYTVLATINDSNTKQLLALATGTQACNRIYEHDIEDCHAESLLKRAFKRHILNKSHDHVTSINALDRSKSKQKELLNDVVCQDLTLFITQFPCGFLKRYEGEDIQDPSTGRPIKRKPGRGSFIQGKGLVYVEREPCLEKLRRWLLVGFQGNKFARDLGLCSRINKIIIGQCEPDLTQDYDKLLLDFRNTLNQSIENGQKLDIVLLPIRRPEFTFSSEKQAQPISIVWWSDPSREVTCQELVVDGRKRGITKKQCINDINRSKLRISTSALNEDLVKLLDILKTWCPI